MPAENVIVPGLVARIGLLRGIAILAVTLLAAEVT
jgi:hypothetical protein